MIHPFPREHHLEASLKRIAAAGWPRFADSFTHRRCHDFTSVDRNDTFGMDTAIILAQVPLGRKARPRIKSHVASKAFRISHSSVGAHEVYNHQSVRTVGMLHAFPDIAFFIAG